MPKTHQYTLGPSTMKEKCGSCFYDDTMTFQRLILFMTRLLKDVKRIVYLILDNLRVHHSEKLTQWIEAHKEKITVFYLPAYAPELNPDE